MTGSVAKNYAVALYELAVEEGMAEAVNDELKAVVAAFADNPELYDVLSAPTISENDKQGVVDEIFKGRLSEISLNFLSLITVKGRIRALGNIADEYRNMWYESNNIMEVTVTSAVPLSLENRMKLSNKLVEKYGKKIIMEEKVDSTIMGGMIVRFGDTMLDGSVKSKLDRMRSNMKNTIA